MNRTVKEVRSSTPRRVLAAGGLGLGLLLAAGSPALAQSASDTNYGGVGSTTTVPTTSTTSTTAATSSTTSTTVRTSPGGTTQTQPPTTATQVRGATQTRGATLPVTGGDAVGLSVLGAGLVAAGALAVKSSRRRSAAEA